MREARSELVTVVLSPREKTMLQELAQNQGASMRGLIRTLIRDTHKARLGVAEIAPVERITLEAANAGR